MIYTSAFCSGFTFDWELFVPEQTLTTVLRFSDINRDDCPHRMTSDNSKMAGQSEEETLMETISFQFETAGQELPPLFGQCSVALFVIFMWFVLTETTHTKMTRTGFWPIYRLAWFCSFFLCSNSPIYLMQHQMVEILSSPRFIPVFAFLGFIGMEQISSIVTHSDYIDSPERCPPPPPYTV